MRDIVETLNVRVLPVIEGYNGEYVNEDAVLETYSEALMEIKHLRAQNKKAAKALTIAVAALEVISISGNHVALHALGQIANDIQV